MAEIERDDIVAISEESIRVIKAVSEGKRKKNEIIEATGLKNDDAKKQLELLMKRGFIYSVGRKNPSYFPTSKASKILLSRSRVHWIMYAGLVLSFFAGLIEFSRFVSLFSPLEFKGEISGFWLVFYSKASLMDGVLTLLMFLIALGFGQIIIERKRKEKMM